MKPCRIVFVNALLALKCNRVFFWNLGNFYDLHNLFSALATFISLPLNVYSALFPPHQNECIVLTGGGFFFNLYYYVVCQPTTLLANLGSPNVSLTS